MKTRSARKIEYWLERGFSQKEAEHLRLTRIPGTFEYFKFFKKLSDEESHLKVEEFKNNKIISLDNMIKRYGKETGSKKFEEYKLKQAYSNTYEYKKNKYGWTKQQFDDYNKSRAVTIDNLIKKHGTKQGKKIYNEYCEKQSKNGKKLEYFIEKYGESEGIKKYTHINKLKSHTFDSYLMKHNGDILKANEAYSNYLNKVNTCTSKLADSFFYEVHTLIKPLKYKEIFFKNLNQEWILRWKNESAIFIDFFVRDIGKVIEFYGDYWHANPKLYKETINFPAQKNLNVKIIHDRDKKRIDKIKRVPYIKGVKIVWEHDYKKNKEKILLDCLDFLNEKR